MSEKHTKTISVEGTEITILQIDDTDYICITDMLKAKDGDFVVKDWLRNRNTLEFLGIWEKVYNPDFNWGEFALIRNQAGLNRFRISVKEYVEKTNAIGLKARAGRYGGTYAHKDIAFEFAMWISPEFKVYLVRDFQRLKEQEQARLGWSAKRELTKINYRIHTDAVQQNLIPKELTPGTGQPNLCRRGRRSQCGHVRHDRAGMAGCEPRKKGNIRDYASINELICLSNMENLNSVFISESRPQRERLLLLNQIAMRQMEILETGPVNKVLK